MNYIHTAESAWLVSGFNIVCSFTLYYSYIVCLSRKQPYFAEAYLKAAKQNKVQ